MSPDTTYGYFNGSRGISDRAQQIPSLWHFATSDGTPAHALIMGIVVGTILTIINQGDFIMAGESPDLLKIGLTYLVPYCVATYGAVTAKRRAWLRENGAAGRNESA